MNKDPKAHIAYEMPYNDISSKTSENIIDMIVSGQFSILAGDLPIKETPRPRLSDYRKYPPLEDDGTPIIYGFLK